MKSKTFLIFTCLLMTVDAEIFNFEKISSYAKLFKFDALSFANETGNELWNGLFKDCTRKLSFSCIQKNAYNYLDDALADRRNITVFDGLTLTKNNMDYGSCPKKDNREDIDENLVEETSRAGCEKEEIEDGDPNEQEADRKLLNDYESPLEEITNALRQKTVKFLATRDYEIQLPEFFFEGATVKISPKEVDSNGALVRVDFAERALESQGRIFFKKIKKYIQNKLLMSFLALLLIIKLIKVKFMFVIPFLFGVGAAKKLFLKLLLFLVPAFAHVFKLCSSYYTTHGTKFHHHHHQIAHHHHHVPVPVPLPTYFEHHHPHHKQHEEDFDGYDYAHPHIQYRKDIEELKEWGIEPYEEPYEDLNSLGSSSASVPGAPGTLPGSLQSASYSTAYGLPQYAPNVRPIMATYQDKHTPSIAAHAQNLGYAAYIDDPKYRRLTAQSSSTSSINPTNVLVSASLPKTAITNQKNPYATFMQQNYRAAQQIQQRVSQGSSTTKSAANGPITRQAYDDDYYGPIIFRLEEIFGHLRFFEENCRERLVCSMYKSPMVYSPHSNLVSNELSRDPQELNSGSTESASSQKFHRYLAAARLGQDGGDCLRMYPCHINTE